MLKIFKLLPVEANQIFSNDRTEGITYKINLNLKKLSCKIYIITYKLDNTLRLQEISHKVSIR